MLDTRKRILLTAAILLPFVLLIAFGILFAVTDVFIFDLLAHILGRIIAVGLIGWACKKGFQNILKRYQRKALLICDCVAVMDLVIVDAIRYALNGGHSMGLLLPVWLPVCFMVIMHFAAKETECEKASTKRWSYIVGIPLLLLAAYFEIISMKGC